jgi:hypothetical protein
MGEFTNGVSPSDTALGDRQITVEPGKIETDVNGIYADGKYERDDLFIFDVDDDKEFYQQGIEYGRRKMTFQTDKINQYLGQTRYTKPFYIRAKNGHIRKIS